MIISNFKCSLDSFRNYLRILLPLAGCQIAASFGRVYFLILMGRAGSTTSIAVYGLSLFFNSIFCSPFAKTTNEMAGVYFSTFFGAKKYEKVVEYFYKTLFVLGFIFAWLLILSIYSDSILIGIGIDSYLALKSGGLILKSMWFIPLVHLNNFIQTFLSSQKIHTHFNILSAISISITILAGYYFIIDQNMLEFGIVPAKLIAESFLFILNMILLFTESNQDCLKLPDFKILCDDLFVYVKRIFISVTSIFSESVCFNYNTYLAAMLHSVDQLAVWESWVSLSIIVFYVSIAVSNTVRTTVGHLIGGNKIKKAKEETQAYFCYTFIVVVFIGFFLFYFGRELALLYLGEPDLVDELVRCIRIYVLFLFPMMMFHPIFTIFRLLGLDYYFMVMIVGVFPGLMIIINTSLVFIFQMQVNGLVWGYCSCLTLMGVVFFHKLFWLVDWEKARTTDRSGMEQEFIYSVEMNQKTVSDQLI